MPMLLRMTFMLLLPVQVSAQLGPAWQPDGADPEAEEAGLPDSAWLSLPGATVAGLDSLERVLASLQVAKAAEAVESSCFWQRLVSLDGGIGMRDLAFPDASGGSLLLPKDSYRLTLSLSLSALIDGSAHTRAELQLAEMKTRFLILLRKQLLARLSLERKRAELSADLEALREEITLRHSAVACQELLFTQGHIDVRTVAAARIDLIRLSHAASRLEARIRELGEMLAGSHAE
jgi:hypothetical protein